MTASRRQRRRHALRYIVEDSPDLARIGRLREVVVESGLRRAPPILRLARDDDDAITTCIDRSRAAAAASRWDG